MADVKINYEVTLFDRYGFVRSIIPAASIDDAEFVADLFILEMRRRSQVFLKVATITRREQLLRPLANGLAKLILTARKGEHHVMWMYHAQDANLVGGLWKASGVYRAFAIANNVVNKPVGRETSTGRKQRYG